MYHESKIIMLPKPAMFAHVAGALLIVVLVLGLGLQYARLTEKEEQLQAKIAAKTRIIAGCKEDKARMDTYLARYEAMIGEFKKILFKEKDISLFLSGISNLSQKNNVSVVSIRNLAEKKITVAAPVLDKKASAALGAGEAAAFTIAVTPLDVNIEGQLDDVLFVLGALEQTRQLLTISNFSFTAKTYPRVNARFQIDMYGLGDKESDE